VPLPDSLSDPRETARTVFDRIAGLYDAARPGYPAPAIAELVARSGLRPESHVLEVGCGTGQLTRSLAALGARLRCLEPGRALAGRAASNLSAFPNVEVVETTFEDADEKEESFDLLVSATAFHWIDPNVSFPKAARLLRHGGSLGLLTNAHGAGGSQAEIAAEVQTLHRRLAPDVGAWIFLSLGQIEDIAFAGGDIAALWHRLERKFEPPPPVCQLFDPPFVGVYPWMAEYDTEGYLAMLASQSTYALMDRTRRAALFAGIGELVEDRLLGRVTKQYVTVLAMARRASGSGSRSLPGAP
jgi:SAM-dependent methyltransferase